MDRSITAADLKARMDSPEGVVILDVRVEDACTSWHIQGPGVTLLNIQNSKLKAQGISAFPEIPKEREVVAVCAKGISARETVRLLAEHHYSAVLLEGGMSAWATFMHDVPVTQSEHFKLYQIQRPGKGCLSYMVISGNQAAVVDAARDSQTYMELAARLGATIRFVMDTHLHADHVSGGPKLATLCNAEYYIAEEEMAGAKGTYLPLANGFRIPFDREDIQMVSLRTPGHTIASTSFLVNGQYLLCGDTIFVSGLGRPDLKGRAREMAAHLHHTVTKILSDLSDDIWVLPSHYASYEEVNENGFVGARLGDIRNRNSLLTMGDRETFVDTLVGRVGDTPPNYENITSVNRGLLDLPSEELSALEVGPNRCAVQP